MMKWKTKTETTNIGVLDLGSITFDDDYMEISIEIFDMSDSLKGEVTKAIEVEKAAYTKTYNAINQEKGFNIKTTWSNKPVVIDFTVLYVHLVAGQPNKYAICVGFHDADDELMESACNITVDLSEYANDLKKAIIKVLVDKFF